ncbi:MAG: amidohydrolase [Erysipelotrichaceae bacterium]|nr:amidohydrolase [Erysipelotrichaceae bacterium]
MKDDLCRTIDRYKEDLLKLNEELFRHPELGFKEFKTRELLKTFLRDHDLPEGEDCALSGFTLSLGGGYPHIGIIAELDAIPTRGHPFADPETTAAHACGHSTQQVIALGALLALKEEELPGKVTLFFTPAEEFTDLDYRKELRSKGKIKYLSGKQNMLEEGIFDDCDCLIHFHAMGASDYRFSVGSVLSGFVHKKITFHGKAAHAAVLPHMGINALHEFTLFLSGVNMLRETFREEDVVRLHGIVTDGGNTVNSIPDKVVYECYVRSVNAEALQKISAEVDRMAEHCAAAFGGSCEIEETPGYLPLHQSPELNEVVEANILSFANPSEILHGEISPAAGDVGDVCMFKPVVQYGYNGFSGRIHGADLCISDPLEACITPAKITAAIVYDLLHDPAKVKQIREAWPVRMTKEEYRRYLSGE